jgi:3-oxoacyl-[acyl-carrier protein] reductase
MMKGKIVLVTGSSRGIGKATALLFGKEGATVVVNYAKAKSEADKVVREIKGMGSNAIALQCDVSEESKVKSMIDTIVKKFGRIDILVNNAGIVFDVPFFKKTLAQWKRTIDVNLIGVFLCTKFAATQMLKQKSGVIVNVASTNGLHKGGGPDSMDYDATKAGVINITASLAAELAPHIRVNCVSPGWVDTDINKNLSKEFRASETEKILLKRWAKPKEIAEVILILASDKASFVNGSNIIADGG